MDTFGGRLIKFRMVHLGMKRQSELVEALKNYYITQGNVSQWESDRSFPNSTKLILLQKAFPELNTDWLLTGQGEMLLPKQKLSPIGSDPEKDELKKQLYDALNQKNEYRDKYISLLEKVNGIDNNKR
jgi:transcriptional regulator with XRE-family HTH domain